MDNNGALNMAMQIIIDHKNLVLDAETAYEEIKRIFSEPIDLVVRGDTNFGTAVNAIKRFEDAVIRLDDRLDGVGESVVGMAEAVAGATDTAVGATNKLSEEKVKVLQKLLGKWEGALYQLEQISSAKFEVGQSDAEGYAKKVDHISDRVDALRKKLESIDASPFSRTPNTQNASRTARVEASAYERAFRGVLSNITTADLKILVRADELIADVEKAFEGKEFTVRIDKKALRAQLQNAFEEGISFKVIEEALHQSLLRQAKAVRSFLEGETVAGKGTKNPLSFTPKVDTNAFKAAIAEMHNLFDSFEKAAADGRPLRLSLDVDDQHLRKAVGNALRNAGELRNAGATLKLAVDRDYLRKDIEDALATINSALNEKLKVGVAGTGGELALGPLKTILSELARAAEATRSAIQTERAGGQGAADGEAGTSGPAGRKNRKLVVAGDPLPTLAEYVRARGGSTPRAGASDDHRKLVEQSLARGIVPSNIEAVLRDYPDMFEKYRKPIESALRNYAQTEADRAESAKRARNRRAASDELTNLRRDQARGNVVEKTGARNAAGQNPLEWLRANFPALTGMHDSVQAIRGMYEPGLDPEELKNRTRQALDAAPLFRRQAVEFEQGGASSSDKEQMKAFAEAFASRYITDLENRAQQVRDNGPRRDPNGALQGVDLLARDHMLAEWEARAAKMRAEVQRLGTYIGGFGAEHRDPWAEALKSFNTYANAIRTFEREMGALGVARETGDEAKQMQRIRAAYDMVNRIETQLRHNVLDTLPGNITLPGITADDKGVKLGDPQEMAKSEAYNRMTEALRRQLGPAFEKVNDSRLSSGGEALSFRDLNKGLFSGDASIIQEFLRAKGIAEDILNNEKAMAEALEKQLGPLSEIKKAWLDIDAEIEVGIRRAQSVMAGTGKAGGNLGGYTNAIRHGAALFGGLGIGYSAVTTIQAKMREYMQLQQELAQIQGVVGGNKNEAGDIGDVVGKSASKWGFELLETVQAARAEAQAGLDVFKELDTTLMGARGLGITIEQMQELAISIHEVTSANDKYNQSVNWTSAVLDKISVVERQYATNAQDLASAVQLLSPVMENFSQEALGMVDSFDLTIGAVTTVVDRLRISGVQAARSIQMMLSRLSNPETLKKIQDTFGARIGTPDGSAYLPFDQMIESLAKRYEELKSQSPAKAQQFAVQLAGGRQINSIVTLLENVDKMQEVATQSANSFGDAERRASEATETLAVATARVHTNFGLFIKNMMDASDVGQGLITIMNGVASTLGGVDGRGGGTSTTIAGILAVGFAYKQVAGIYGAFKSAMKVKDIDTLFTVMDRSGKFGSFVSKLAQIEKAGEGAAKGVSLLSGSLEVLGSIFSPEGVILAGLVGAIALVGAFSRDSDEALNKYKVHLDNLSQSKVWEAPQYIDLSTRASKNGYPTGSAYYDDIMARTVGPQASNQMKSLVDQIPEMLHKDGRELDNWRKQVVDTFIRDLPASHHAMFDSLKTDSEKIAEVVSTLGLASWSANMQIANAVEEMRQSTRALVEDTLKGINSVDVAMRHGVWNRGVGWAKDWWNGVLNNNSDLSQTYKTEYDRASSGGAYDRSSLTRYQQSAYAGTADRLSSSILQQMTPAVGTKFLQEPSVREFLRKAVADAVGDGSHEVRAQVVYSRLWEGIHNNEGGLGDKYRAAMAYATGNFTEAEKISPAIYARERLTPQERTVRDAQEATSRYGEQNVNALMEQLYKDNPTADRIKQLDEALRRLGEAGKVALAGTTQARDAVHAFKDSLLDLVVAFSEAVRKFRFDKDFSKTYGTQFDVGGGYTELGHTLLNQGNDFRTRNSTDITRLQRELATLAERTFSVMDDSGHIPASTKQREDLNYEVGNRVHELRQFGESTLSQILGENSPVYRTLMRDLQQLTTAPLETRAESLERFIERVGDALVRKGIEMNDQQARTIQNLEVEKELTDKRGQLLEAQLPVTATLLDKLSLQYQIQQQAYLLERRRLQTQMSLEGADVNGLKRELDKLDALRQQTVELDAQMEIAKAQTALNQQVRSNIQATFSGVKDTLTNLNIWKDIVAPEGDTSLEKARNRAEAIKNVIIGTITPVFKTFQDRLFENAFKQLTDHLMEKGGWLTKMLGRPELELKEDLAGAQAHEEAIRNGSVTGAQLLMQGIIDGCRDGAALLSASGGTPAPGFVRYGSGAIPVNIAPGHTGGVQAHGNFDSASMARSYDLVRGWNASSTNGGGGGVLGWLKGLFHRSSPNVVVGSVQPTTEDRAAYLAKYGILPEQRATDPARSARIYEAIQPNGYGDEQEAPDSEYELDHGGAMTWQFRPMRALRAIVGLDNPPRVHTFGSREDAWRMYLGLSQQDNTFGISRYRPARSTDPTTTYYTLPSFLEGVRKSGLFEEISGNHIASQASKIVKPGATDADAIRGMVEAINRSGGTKIIANDNAAGVMGNFTLSRGMDSRGSYISYYDKWDLDPSNGVFGGLATRVAGNVGRPYEIYNRMYYNPATYEPIENPTMPHSGGAQVFNSRPWLDTELLDRIGLNSKNWQQFTPPSQDPGAMPSPAPTQPAKASVEVALSPEAKRAQKEMMYATVGMLVGNIGGTIAGKGGPGAQAGSQIGSTAGGMIGMSVAGPPGAIVGSMLGGVLGGFLGGKSDRKKQQDPVVRGLEAIERAQRETIDTIKVGNDALLKPENRLLNLPATFSIPAYMPSFGDGSTGPSTGGNSTSNVSQQNHFTFNIDGGDPAAVKKAVVEALNQTLDGGMTNSSWGKSSAI